MGGGAAVSDFKEVSTVMSACTHCSCQVHSPGKAATPTLLLFLLHLLHVDSCHV